MLTQAVHEWHKAVVHVQQQNQKLAQVNSALGAALTYFTEASDELAKASTFSAWKHEMNDKERKQWRTLVRVMPPLPPGFEKKATPPLPPGMGDPAAGGQTVVTNSLR